MATEPPAPQRRENVFTRRIGPLPMWVWLVLVAVIVLGWALLRRRQQGTTGQAADAGATTDASQVPQFVNQTFTTVQPPAQPVVPAPRAGESEETEDETQTAQQHRKRPVNRRHPTAPRFTVEQEREAWAPGRLPSERGKLFIRGRWVTGVPQPPGGAPPTHYSGGPMRRV